MDRSLKDIGCDHTVVTELRGELPKASHFHIKLEKSLRLAPYTERASEEQEQDHAT